MMKIVALFLIAFAIVSASFPPSTEATAASGSTSKRSGEACDTTPKKLNALQLCFDGMSRGLELPNSCCETMNETQDCLCDEIKHRVTLNRSVIRSHLKSCGVPEPKYKECTIPERSGEACGTTPKKLNALQLCFDGMSRGLELPNSCCETMKETQACMCDEIKHRVTLSKSVISSQLKSCGVPEPKC